jgi:hypothetical protein
MGNPWAGGPWAVQTALFYLMVGLTVSVLSIAFRTCTGRTCTGWVPGPLGPSAKPIWGMLARIKQARGRLGFILVALVLVGITAVYLFDATTGNLLHSFRNPTPAAKDQFGRSVAISGDKVLVGAQLDDAGARDSGAAYLFDAATGSFLHTFLNPTPARGDGFGGSVAISGNKVLVGASGRDAGAKNSGGTAYLFSPVPTSPR